MKTIEELQKEVDRLTRNNEELKKQIRGQQQHNQKLYLFIQKQQRELIQYNWEEQKDND